MFVQEMQLMAYFIDEEGLVTETNADSIVFVVDHSGHKNDKWRGLLKADEEGGFICARRLYPPYECRTRIIFRFKDEDTITLSTYPIDLDKATGETVSDDI